MFHMDIECRLSDLSTYCWEITRLKDRSTPCTDMLLIRRYYALYLEYDRISRRDTSYEVAY